MTELYIKDIQLMDQTGQLYPAELWVKQGKVAGIGTDLSPLVSDKAQIIEGKKNLLAPGFVDLHVHFREPGFTHKETIASGSRSAAKGGFTTVCAMPNLNPVPDNVADYQYIQQLIETDSVIQTKQYGSITKALKSSELVDMKELKEAGVFAFTNDGVGVQSAGTMYLAMKEAAKLGLPIVAHTEDESLLFGGCMHEGKRSKELGLPGILSAAESSQIARDLVLAEATGCHYHVCHVSTKESVALIRQAKQAGVHVTCEVCPHHLILTDQDIPEDNGQYKMNPPLRAEEDRQALINGLKDGTIDCIATDHAPHTAEEKEKSMTEAAFGIVGSETAFPLLYTEFVQTGIFTLKEVLDWLTIKPAQVFQLAVGEIKVGSSADVTLLDLDTCYHIDSADFVSASSNTPFLNKQVQGKSRYTVANGQIVWQEEEK